MSLVSWLPRRGWSEKRTLPVPFIASFRSIHNARRFALSHERLGYAVKTTSHMAGRIPVWDVEVS
jgi:hypothetical protein